MREDGLVQCIGDAMRSAAGDPVVHHAVQVDRHHVADSRLGVVESPVGAHVQLGLLGPGEVQVSEVPGDAAAALCFNDVQ
jgi:hypothetical protein